MTIETANRLYELRKQKGLSQEELAEKLGVSRQAVSKWERSEASPDTDNLIALAKIYDLTLDELIFGEKKQEKENTNEEPTADPVDDAHDSVNKVNIGPSGIFVESEDGDKVHISLKGIKITEGERSKYDKSGVKINLGGLKIGADASLDFGEEDDDCDLDKDEDLDIEIKNGSEEIYPRKRRAKFWYAVPYPVICAVVYLLFGFYNVCGGWANSWIIFITIPLYYSLIDVIVKKRLDEFAYPVFTVLAYLYMGLYLGNWHPSWIVFVTIPIYYPIAHAIDKMIHKSK